MPELIVDTKQLNRMAIELSKLNSQTPQAMASALNRTMDFTSKKISDIVREQYIIKKKDITKTLKKYRASRSRLSARIESKGRSLSLMNFKVSPRKPTKSKRPVRVQIKKKGEMKPLSITPSAFVQTMKNATNVWQRETNKRFPVKRLSTLSVPQMISNEDTFDSINKLAQDKLFERLEHEINYRISKSKRAIKG